MYRLFVFTSSLFLTYGVPFVCILQDHCPWGTVHYLLVFYRITGSDLRWTVCLYLQYYCSWLTVYCLFVFTDYWPVLTVYCLFVFTGLLALNYDELFVCIYRITALNLRCTVCLYLQDYWPVFTVYCLFVFTGFLALNYDVLFVRTYRITVCDLRCTVCLYFTWLLSLTYGVLFVCINRFTGPKLLCTVCSYLQDYCLWLTVYRLFVFYMITVPDVRCTVWLYFTELLSLSYGFLIAFYRITCPDVWRAIPLCQTMRVHWGYPGSVVLHLHQSGKEWKHIVCLLWSPVR